MKIDRTLTLLTAAGTALYIGWQWLKKESDVTKDHPCCIYPDCNCKEKLNNS